MSKEEPKKILVSTPEVKEMLEKIDPEKADQIQKRTLDFVMKFSKATAQEAKEMRRRLVKEAGLTDEEAVEVVNITPKSIEELRAFTAGWKKLFPTEQLERILSILRRS